MAKITEFLDFVAPNMGNHIVNTKAADKLYANLQICRLAHEDYILTMLVKASENNGFTSISQVHKWLDGKWAEFTNAEPQTHLGMASRYLFMDAVKRVQNKVAKEWSEVGSAFE